MFKRVLRLTALYFAYKAIDYYVTNTKEDAIDDE